MGEKHRVLRILREKLPGACIRLTLRMGRSADGWAPSLGPLLQQVQGEALECASPGDVDLAGLGMTMETFYMRARVSAPAASRLTGGDI